MPTLRRPSGVIGLDHKSALITDLTLDAHCIVRTVYLINIPPILVEMIGGINKKLFMFRRV